MPLLYSPLYQSIRLILFGALGLSSLTVSAAINQTDSMMPEPLVTDSSNQYADDVATDAGFNNEINNQDISYQSDSQQSAAYKKASLSSDATLSNDAAVNNNNITAINDRTKTSQDSRVAPVNTSNAAKAGNRRIDTNDESIQESLKRLAEFYELTPDTNVATSNNTGTSVNDEQNNIQNSLTPVTTNIPTVGSNLRLLPHTVDSAARCEGQWVYPKKNPNYQRAVNEASASSGQPAPNLNGLPNNQAPLFAESDYGYYDNVDYAELSGNVIIDQGTQHIEAEKIVLDLSNGVAAAQGKVMFTDQATGNVSVNGAQDRTQQNGKTSLTDKATQGGLIGVADNLNYNTETGQSTATNVAFASVELQAHGYAKRLNRPNESQYELDEVMYSTCPPTNRKWQFDAKSIDLDTETGRGEAYNTTFRIADVPVFYLPYFNFPIDSRRGSGFLLPNASISSENGLEIDVPYYFNLAPNYDATLSTHIYTTRNPMLSGEFRYLTENYGEGIFNGSYLPNDKEYDGEDRRSLFYDHYWSSTSIPRLSGEAKYSYVSDADYLNDFDTLGLSDNTLNLPRRAQLNYYNDYVVACAFAEFTVAAWALTLIPRAVIKPIDRNTAWLVWRKEKNLMMLLINVIASDGNRLNPLATALASNNVNTKVLARVVYNRMQTSLYHTY